MFTASCSRFAYGVDLLNLGEHGVLLLEIGDRKATAPHSAYVSLGVSQPIIAGRFPGIPSRYRDPASFFGHFTGYNDSLPEEIVVVWQLAEMRNCKSEHRVQADSEYVKDNLRGRDYGRTEYVDKSGCTWHPLPSKVFRQKLDIKAIRSTEAYRRTGTRYKDVAGSRYTLNLTLIFIEDQVKVEVDNGATNPWL